MELQPLLVELDEGKVVDVGHLALSRRMRLLADSRRGRKGRASVAIILGLRDLEESLAFERASTFYFLEAMSY